MKGVMKGIWDFRKNAQKGFTLVELLVVIAIIGILATLVLLQLGTARSRARDTRRITTVAQVQTAVETYAEDNNGDYPTTITDVTTYLSGTNPLGALGTLGTNWGYAVNATTSRYHLWVELENDAAALDNDADTDSTSGYGTGSSQDGAVETCTDDAGVDCVYDLSN